MIGYENMKPRENEISRPLDGVLLQRCAGRQASGGGQSWHVCEEELKRRGGEEGVGTAVEKNDSPRAAL